VFLFLAGACVFGTIISNTNTVLTELGREAAELAERMEGYQALISSCRSQSSLGPSGSSAEESHCRVVQIPGRVPATAGVSRPERTWEYQPPVIYVVFVE
jgi:hypothetical protein